MHLRIFLGCAAIYFVHGELAAADDILAMLQRDLQTTRHGQGTTYHQSGPVGKSELMTGVARLAEMIMVAIKEDKDLGDDALVSRFNESVQVMYKGIRADTRANQNEIADSIKAFTKCNKYSRAVYSKAVITEGHFWRVGKLYPKCTREEMALKLKIGVYKKDKRLLKNDVKVARLLEKAKGRKCTNVCSKGRLENYHEELKRLGSYYGKCAKDLEPAGKKLAKLEKQLKETVKLDKESAGKYQVMKDKCKLIAWVMNKYKCAAVTNLHLGCDGYGACWKTAKKNYDKVRKFVAREEMDMKIGWRALRRMECFLGVLDEKKR